MGKYIKTEKHKAESTRNAIHKEKIYDSSRKVEYDEKHVYFPVKQDISGFDLVERAGEENEVKPKSYKETLKDKISHDLFNLLPTSFDIIGDIAVLELDENLSPYEKDIGQAIIQTYKNIKTVALKETSISTTYRTRKIRVISGIEKTETIHKEHGLKYKIDVEKAYFSPRSAGERKRVIDQIRAGENVLVLFAGVGPFAILAAKEKKCSVTAVELNHEAVEYMRENVALNKVDVEVIEGDAKKITSKLGKFDRIIMPLPKDAETFLDVAIPVLNPGGVINLYVFKHDLEEAEKSVREICERLGYTPQVAGAVYCGSFSPCLSRICIDFSVTKATKN